MEAEEVVGPVFEEGERVRQGTRIQLDLPAGPVLIVNSAVFVSSGWFLYQSIKGLYRLNKESVSA